MLIEIPNIMPFCKNNVGYNSKSAILVQNKRRKNIELLTFKIRRLEGIISMAYEPK